MHALCPEAQCSENKLRPLFRFLACKNQFTRKRDYNSKEKERNSMENEEGERWRMKLTTRKLCTAENIEDRKIYGEKSTEGI